jgi:hypothetical protein
LGQHLARIEDDAAQALTGARSELQALTKSREWEAAKTAADLAGIVDPSPTSDAVSLGMSLVEGDWVGAALSGVSFVPYLGDAVAKPIKAVRATRTIAAIERRAAALVQQINHLSSNAAKLARHRQAAAAERARRKAEAAERYAEQLKCKTCPQTANRFGTQLPTTGRWQGERGHSRWTSDDGSVSLNYSEGFPDFRSSIPPSLHPAGGGQVEIPMTGANSDFTAARNAMREKLDDPSWPGGRGLAPEGYTWHHTEDGVTMQLVKRSAHDKALSGAAHTGGASVVSGAGSQF